MTSPTNQITIQTARPTRVWQIGCESCVSKYAVIVSMTDDINTDRPIFCIWCTQRVIAIQRAIVDDA